MNGSGGGARQQLGHRRTIRAQTMASRKKPEELVVAVEHITPEEVKVLSPLIGAIARLAMKRLREEETAKRATTVEKAD